MFIINNERVIPSPQTRHLPVSVGALSNFTFAAQNPQQV